MLPAAWQRSQYKAPLAPWHPCAPAAGQSSLRLWEYDRSIRKLRPADAALGATTRNFSALEVDPSDALLYAGTSTGDVVQVGGWSESLGLMFFMVLQRTANAPERVQHAPSQGSLSCALAVLWLACSSTCPRCGCATRGPPKRPSRRGSPPSSCCPRCAYECPGLAAGLGLILDGQKLQQTARQPPWQVVKKVCNERL